MADDYEYHKQNDYPGERTAEKKRVADRAEAADKRSDARVAEKGRTEGLKADNRVARQGRRKDKMLDSEIERSAARAKGVNRSRNTADAIGLMIGVVVVAGLLVGLGWSYVTIRQQADEIDALNQQIVSANNVQTALSPTTSNLAPLSDANRQMQLYIDFLVLAADTKEEVNTLKQYNGSYSNM
jgi:type VI protein secretion system component VasK